MDFTQIKDKRRRSLENQLFESPDASLTKRIRKFSVPPTPSTADSRNSLSSEASTGFKSLDGRSSGRRRIKQEGLSRSQSCLFPNETTESTIETATLLPSSQETQGTSSRLFQSPEKPLREPFSTDKSSFFGAVMSNVHHFKCGQPSTPQTSGFQNFVASPGGFNLMNFVNSVTSPFHPKRNCKDPSTPMNPPTPSTPRYGPATPRHEREWHQTSLSRSGEVKWIDWTLKSKLEFECSPGHSLHRSSALTQHKAKLQFLTSTKKLPTLSSTRNNVSPQHAIEEACIQWEESLLYWQYPATLHHHESFREESLRDRKAVVPLFQNSNGLARSNSMPATVFTKAVQKAKNDANQQISLHSYEREWQESFTSIYTSWIECVKQQCETDQDLENDLFADEVAATYFYAQRVEHTVLFKVGLYKGSGKDVTVIPEIIISSTNQEQREKLRSLGVTWRLLEHYLRNKNEFQENPSESNVAKENYEKGTMSSELDEDLIALRRAQVCGKTVGADVSISTTSRLCNKLSATSKLVSPLFLSGFEDCEKFYLFYRNTIGLLGTEETQKKGLKVKSDSFSVSSNVPLLLCRKLGPFLNSSLKRLEIHYANFESKSENSADLFDTAEVSGIILPCAVRALINAAIHSVKSATGPSNNEETSKDSSESIVSANHLIVQLSLPDPSIGRPSRKKDGLSCSSFFNTNSLLWDSISDSESYEVCHFGESVETAVWDVNRPQDVAFKLRKLNVWDFK